MKILIVNTSDIGGGAARAANRLHKGLISQGVDSMMLVQQKKSEDRTVIGPTTAKEKLMIHFRPKLDQLYIRKYKNKVIFSPSMQPFTNIVDEIESINPDIVHLHWINLGMINIYDLAKIKKPIVWSLHDMWPFTGGCHYDGGCEKYKNECGACPVLLSDIENDMSKKIFEKKLTTYRKIKDLTIVGLSKWMASCASASTLLKHNTVLNLPNPIDSNIYKPVLKNIARDMLNITCDKKIILFGASGATSDVRKGFKELLDALNKLKLDNVELVVFGSEKPEVLPAVKFKLNFIGELYDDVSLMLVYNTADVMVVPSLQENLSNAIMESLSCGTPVVGFDIGGNSDMIEHEKTGYLAQPYDTTDLADGIEFILSAPNYDEICQNARAKVMKEFDSTVVTKKYIRLYKDILKDV